MELCIIATNEFVKHFYSNLYDILGWKNNIQYLSIMLFFVKDLHCRYSGNQLSFFGHSFYVDLLVNIVLEHAQWCLKCTHIIVLGSFTKMLNKQLDEN